MNSHILLVEDQQRLARIVQLELADQGYCVSVRHDGKAGFSAVEDIKPDLIILDWCLPGLSGLEICRRLRQADSQIPIIFVTAMDSDSDRHTGLKAGANDYVVKPFNIEQLVTTVKNHLRGTTHCPCPCSA
ncbi:MAG TPA: response regulator transcription factor [Elainellaceae cyanobacterium]